MKKIIYKYEDKDIIKKKLVYELLNKMYSISYPKPTIDFETMNAISRVISTEKYHYPIDFYYLPNSVIKDLTDDFRSEHNIVFSWKDNMQFLIDTLFVHGGIKEVYGPTEWSKEPLRHCETIKTLDNYIPKEHAEKVKEILEGYRDTYKFKKAEYDSFNFNIFNYAPNINKDYVIAAWKQVFDKEIKIPEDSQWIDEYEALHSDN